MPPPTKRRRSTRPPRGHQMMTPAPTPGPSVEASGQAPSTSVPVDQATRSSLRSEITKDVLTTLQAMGFLKEQSAPQPPNDDRPSTDAPLVNDQSVPSFQPTSLSLGATIPAKVKSKIWAGEFVDLQSLSPSSSPPPPVPQASHPDSQAKTSSTKVSQPANVEEWSDLFFIYAAIYTEAHPTAAQSLFKYCSVVRTLSTKCPHYWWLFYDVQFRKLKAQTPSMPWGTTHHELYLHCLTQGAALPQPVLQDSNKADYPRAVHGPDGVCWRFWNDGSCGKVNCPFRHETNQECTTPEPAASLSFRAQSSRASGRDP